MSPKTVAKASPAVAIEQTNQYWALAETIRQSAPETVRQAIRDHWEKALVGSQFHVAFLVSLWNQYPLPHISEVGVTCSLSS